MYLVIKQTSDSSCGFGIKEFNTEKEAKIFIDNQEFKKCFRVLKLN